MNTIWKSWVQISIRIFIQFNSKCILYSRSYIEKNHNDLRFETDWVVAGQKPWIDSMTLFQRPMMKLTTLAPFVGSSTSNPESLYSLIEIHPWSRSLILNQQTNCLKDALIAKLSTSTIDAYSQQLAILFAWKMLAKLGTGTVDPYNQQTMYY